MKKEILKIQDDAIATPFLSESSCGCAYSVIITCHTVLGRVAAPWTHSECRKGGNFCYIKGDVEGGVVRLFLIRNCERKSNKKGGNMG